MEAASFAVFSADLDIHISTYQQNVVLRYLFD